MDRFFPIFQAGQFKKDADRTMMPLSITVNHATIDGDHLSHFFNELQSYWEQPTRYLSWTLVLKAATDNYYQTQTHLGQYFWIVEN